MMRLIDADAFWAGIKIIHMNHKLSDSEEMKFTESDIRALLESEPTIDAVPVVHGEWKYIYYRSDVIGRKCSICGGICGKDWNFCPNCGARMDLDGQVMEER